MSYPMVGFGEEILFRSIKIVHAVVALVAVSILIWSGVSTLDLY